MKLDHLIQLGKETYGEPPRSGVAKDISRYYHKSRLGYALVQSREGGMHMKIDSEEFYQAAHISSVIKEGEKVLELGCGNGANIAFLEKRASGAQYSGLDLSPEHIKRAKKVCQTDALYQASFQKIPEEGSSFDIVFAVETLCHSSDPKEALAEAHRVLRSGGSLFIFDGWRRKDLSPKEQEAASLAERAMAVYSGLEKSYWIQAAKAAGFVLEREEDYSARIRHNTGRLQARSFFFIDHPRLRPLLRLLPKELRMNGLAALLIDALLEKEVFEYGLLEFRKKSA